MLGTLQGSTVHKYLDDYLNEFVFRFNRRKSASRGKLVYRTCSAVRPNRAHDLWHAYEINRCLGWLSKVHNTFSFKLVRTIVRRKLSQSRPSSACPVICRISWL